MTTSMTTSAIKGSASCRWSGFMRWPARRAGWRFLPIPTDGGGRTTSDKGVLPEGRLHDAGGSHLRALQPCRRSLLMKDVDGIAVGHFLDLGGEPDEAAAGGRFLPDHAIDLLLSTHIDAAHGIVEEDDRRVRRQSTREQYFLLVAAAKCGEQAVDPVG